MVCRKLSSVLQKKTPLLRWRETMQSGPEGKNVLVFEMATCRYVQQWDDLHLVDGVLHSKDTGKHTLLLGRI